MTCYRDERFERAVEFVLEHEGGLSNHPSDPGGITNFGISLRFLKGAGYDINADGRINRDDILALDKDKAKIIYRREWWDKYQYNRIHCLAIAKKVFDFSVNMGPFTSHVLLQQSVNALQMNQLTVDGIIGSKTVDAINSCPDGYLLEELKERAERKYRAIADKHPELSVFLKGWLRRAHA